MHKVWIVAWNDLQLTLREKQNWFLLLVLPVLVIYIVGLGAQGFARLIREPIRIDVLDGDHSAASEALVADLAESNANLVVCSADDAPGACALGRDSLTPALAEERLANGTTCAILTIPQGFGDSLDRGDKVTLGFQSNAISAAPEIAFRAVQNVAARMGGPVIAANLSAEAAEAQGIETDAAFFAARLADAKEAWGPFSPVQVTSEFTPRNKGQIIGAQLLENGFKLSTPGIAAMFVMLSVFGLTQSLAEERMLGILRRVGMMPVSKAQFLGGKLLRTVLLGWLQFAFLLGFGGALGVDFGSNPLALVVVSGAYVFAVTAMALALATLARTLRQASGIATFAWLVLTPMGGAWWPLAFVSPWMQVLGHLSPVAWCLDALNALIYHQSTLPEVLGPVGALLLFAAGFFALGVTRLDTKESRVLPGFGPRKGSANR